MPPGIVIKHTGFGDQVEKLQVVKTLRFLENGVTVELINKDRHKFIVDGPTDWIEKITNQKQLVN